MRWIVNIVVIISSIAVTKRVTHSFSMHSSSRNGPYIRDNRSSAIETAQGSDPSLSPSLPSAAAQVQLLTHVEVQRRVDQQSSSSSNISSNYSLLTLQKYVAAPIASKGQWMAIFNEKGCDDGNGDGGNSIVKEDSIFFIAHLKRIELPSSPPAKNHHHHHHHPRRRKSENVYATTTSSVYSN